MNTRSEKGASGVACGFVGARRVKRASAGLRVAPLAQTSNALTEQKAASAAIQRAGKSLKDFDIAPFISVAMNDDLDAAFDSLRPYLALYIGGMGAKGKNFYNDYATRLGYGDVAERIQDLYLSGQKPEAEALIPNEFIDEVALVGPKDRIRERLQRWKEAGTRGEVGSMLMGISDPEVMQLMAEEML